MFSRSFARFAPVMEDVVAAFKILGLAYNPRTPAAARPGVEDVRRQYREMARLHHPDLSSGDDNRMKVINTAYELIQSSGVLQGAYEVGGSKDTVSAAPPHKHTSSAASRFAKKAGSRRRRIPDDFANGDDASWSMKTQLDWQSMMNSTDSVTEAELKNPANHPFSHSRFFSFEDDVSIYRMIRGGATVRQVARTLGKPATFVERRLQNAQFKLRVQYVLRQEKRGAGAADRTAVGGKPTTSTPVAEPTTRRALRRSPYEDVMGSSSYARAAGSTPSAAGPSSASSIPLRRREWEPTNPEWRAPRYRAQMSLEEQGRLDGLLKDGGGEDWDAARSGASRGSPSKGRGTSPAGPAPHRAASKMGRSYENYQRMQR